MEYFDLRALLAILVTQMSFLIANRKMSYGYLLIDGVIVIHQAITLKINRCNARG